MIRRFFTRLLIVGLLVCFGVFYGVDLATNGIEEIHGPMEPVSQEQPAEEREESEASAEEESPELGKSAPPPYDLSQPVNDPTLVNALADATGNVLQRTARGGIELIVSMFDGILH